MDIKVGLLFLKEDKKTKANKWKEVKKDASLTVEEIAYVDSLIAELEE